MGPLETNCKTMIEGWGQAAENNMKLAKIPSPFSLFFFGCAVGCAVAQERTKELRLASWIADKKFS